MADDEEPTKVPVGQVCPVCGEYFDPCGVDLCDQCAAEATTVELARVLAQKDEEPQ